MLSFFFFFLPVNTFQSQLQNVFDTNTAVKETAASLKMKEMNECMTFSSIISWCFVLDTQRSKEV